MLLSNYMIPRMSAFRNILSALVLHCIMCGWKLYDVIKIIISLCLSALSGADKAAIHTWASSLKQVEARAKNTRESLACAPKSLRKG